MVNKYADELRKEKDMIAKQNPFTGKKPVRAKKEERRSVPYVNQKEKSHNYFSLILSSDFQELEMEIRGLRHYIEIDGNGKEIKTIKMIKDHYLSEAGAEDLLVELKGHLSSDIKLGIMTREEFLMQQDIIRKFLVSYISNNLYKLGMDTEEKQRKASTLLVMMLARIRSVYSRSIAGLENQRSHGDIKLSGDLDGHRDDMYKVEDLKN